MIDKAERQRREAAKAAEVKKAKKAKNAKPAKEEEEANNGPHDSGLPWMEGKPESDKPAAPGSGIVN